MRVGKVSGTDVVELGRCHGGSGVEGGGIFGAESRMENGLDLGVAEDVRDVGK